MTQAEFFFLPRASWPFDGFERAAARGCGPGMRRARCGRNADAPRCGPAAKHNEAPSADERRIALDVRETANELIIEADVPGCTKDRIVIETLDGKLHLSVMPTAGLAVSANDSGGDAAADQPGEDDAAARFKAKAGAQKRAHGDGANIKWHRKEISRKYGKRVLKLPENVDSDNIAATLELGVLTVKIPLVELPPKTKRVVVA